MATDRNTNSNTVFLVIGGLIILALIFGFIYMRNPANSVYTQEPAAGMSATGTTPDTTPAPATP